MFSICDVAHGEVLDPAPATSIGLSLSVSRSTAYHDYRERGGSLKAHGSTVRPRQTRSSSRWRRLCQFGVFDRMRTHALIITLST
eukprot:4200857-Prymnesium_polylepis.1